MRSWRLSLTFHKGSKRCITFWSGLLMFLFWRIQTLHSTRHGNGFCSKIEISPVPTKSASSKDTSWLAFSFLQADTRSGTIITGSPGMNAEMSLGQVSTVILKGKFEQLCSVSPIVHKRLINVRLPDSMLTHLLNHNLYRQSRVGWYYPDWGWTFDETRTPHPEEQSWFIWLGPRDACPH